MVLIKGGLISCNSVIYSLLFQFLKVFVETLDRCFENVCELDLIFHVDKVHNILQVGRTDSLLDNHHHAVNYIISL